MLRSAVARTGSRTSPPTLRVWTVQPDLVWRRLRLRRRLRTDRRYREGLHACYEWLVGQLRRRLPGYRGGYPWWAYASRPDLRRVRHEKDHGRRYWLLELEVPADRLLLFPAWAWDAIFYGEYLPMNRREERNWQQRLRRAVPDAETLPRLPEPWETELRQSWERLFNPRLPVQSWRPRTQGHSDVEAVFEVLELPTVRKARLIVGARAPAPPVDDSRT